MLERHLEGELPPIEIADDDDDVMGKSDNGADSELPLETEPDVKNDRDERSEHSDGSGRPQLTRNGGTDNFNAALHVSVAKRRNHLVERLLLSFFAPWLLFETDENVVGRPEFLDLDITQIKRSESLPHLGDIDRSLGRLQLDHGAALEVDAIVQPAREQQPE